MPDKRECQYDTLPRRRTNQRLEQKKKLADLGGYDTIFDNCCHGGARKKSSKFWGSKPWFLPLAAACPGDATHKHKTWHPQIVDGKVQYPTAEEAAYPNLLCSRMAEIVREQLLSMGVVDVDNLQQQLEVEQKVSSSCDSFSFTKRKTL